MTNKRLFFNYVNYIEMEISSYCNRRCSYCPQSQVERKREVLPLEIVQKIADELSTINFCGGVAFHQYNEPLLEFEHLVQCIRIIKKTLPKVKLVLYTNGDELTKQSFRQLKKEGIHEFHISCHYKKDEVWSKESAYKRLRGMQKKIHYYRGKFEYQDYGVFIRPNKIRNAVFNVKAYGWLNIRKYPVIVFMESVNYHIKGSNRLKTVPNIQLSKAEENDCSYFCSNLFHGMNISYKGNAYLCCDCCEGTKEAKPFLLGSIKEHSMFELYGRKEPFIQEYLYGNTPENCVECYWNQ